MSIEVLKTCGLIILLAPLAGSLLAAGFGSRFLKGASHWPPILGVAAALAASIVLLAEVRSAPSASSSQTVPLYTWVTTGDGSAGFRVELLIDPLTSLMLLVVTGVALLVLIYSRDYMRHHGRPAQGYSRFFACVALFVFSMCGLVLGGNFLLLYFGWEAVGLCSYLLIGFYYDKPSAAAAAKKAFLVNRVGDFGFGLGILLIYLTFGSLEYSVVFELVQQGITAAGEPVSGARLTTIALLLLCGACGKSAQLPLHVWLPDAMEGPSPVSALIHAATMVTAGVFMVARCGAIFAASPTAMIIVAAVGCATALFAASIALVQTDMKRVLAYSTMSQLGYMFLGLGVYAADSAVFHLWTHAFFKALLFLGAGSVMHALGGVIDVRTFSGMRSSLPWTFRMFLIGSLALAGFPLLSGFFSKDEILHQALAVHPVLGVLGLVTALLTAFYTFRIFFLAFCGPVRIPQGTHPHEAGGWMLGPLFVLCLGAVLAGYVGTEGTNSFHAFLRPVFADTFSKHAPHTPPPVTFWAHYGLMIVSGALSVFGIFMAYILYVRLPWIPSLARASLPKMYRTLWNKYFIDEAYQRTLVEPVRKSGVVCVGLDDYVLDGLLWIITAVPRGLALLLRTAQSGMVQGYALTMVLGLTLMVLAILWG